MNNLPNDEIEAVRGETIGRTSRGRRSRARLLAAARVIFEQKGFLDARVADITQEAGMGQGSFYSYWQSKAEVFMELVTDLDEALSDCVQVPREIHGPYARMEAANRRYFQAYRENAALIATWEQVCTFNPIFSEMRQKIRQRAVQRISAHLRRLQDRGLADPALDAECAAKALASMVSHFAYMWLTHAESESEDRAVATVSRLWANAVGLRICPIDGGPPPLIAQSHSGHGELTKDRG